MATEQLGAAPGVASDLIRKTDFDAHVNDTSDAHDASAVSYAGSAGLSATDVEGALDELDTEKVPLSATVLTNSAWAAASAGLTVTTTITDITGATVTITTDVANTIVVVIAVIDIDSAGVTGVDTFVGHLNVDGTNVSSPQVILLEQQAAGEQSRITATQTWRITLASAGSHTLKLRASKTTNTAGAITVQSTHTTILVLGRF